MSTMNLDKVLESLLTGAGGDLDALQKAMESGKGNYEEKDKFWSCVLDKKNFGSAVLRFLPSINPAVLPYAEYYRHSFKGPGGMWYIEACPTTIGQECPLCEYNSERWKEGENSAGQIFVRGYGSGQNRVAGSKRNQSWKTNVLVLSHTGNPLDDGKVFPMSLGPALIKEIKAAMHKDNPKKINPFSLTEGANFRLEIRPGDKGLDFTKSTFESPSALWADKPNRMDLLKALFTPYDKETGIGFMDLSKFTDPKNFKSYDDLEAKLNKVLKRTETGTAGTKVDQPVASQPSQGPTASSPKKEEAPFKADEDEDPIVAKYKSMI